MALRLSKAQAKQYGLTPRPTAKKLTARQRYGGFRSGWEQEYAAYLTRHPAVQSWQYEAVRLKLAEGTTYTPDFLVVTTTGALEMHEVKGIARPAGMVKIKVAAKLFGMFTFYLVRKVNRLWELQEIRR